MLISLESGFKKMRFKKNDLIIIFEKCVIGIVLWILYWLYFICQLFYCGSFFVLKTQFSGKKCGLAPNERQDKFLFDPYQFYE